MIINNYNKYFVDKPECVYNISSLNPAKIQNCIIKKDKDKKNLRILKINTYRLNEKQNGIKEFL